MSKHFNCVSIISFYQKALCQQKYIRDKFCLFLGERYRDIGEYDIDAKVFYTIGSFNYFTNVACYIILCFDG